MSTPPPAPIAWRLIADGELAYPRELIFANVAATELGAARVGAQVITPYHALVVETAHRTILVDAGLGELAGDMGGTAGRLVAELRAHGFEPSDIDDVLVTHAHPDHVGGLTTHGAPTFARARHHITEMELEFWLGPSPEDHLDPSMAEMLVATARSTLNTLRKAGHLVPCAADVELVPGVRLIDAPGHTPGHVAVELDNGGDTLIYLGDVVLHELQLAHPEWVSAVDVDPAATIATRHTLLDRAVEDGALVTGFHLPATGRVARHGTGYRLEPVGRTA